MNTGLTKNLLPLCTGRELTDTETLELLEEVKGKTDKAKMFNYSNKNTIVLKTRVHNYRFPIVQKDYVLHRLYEKKNNNRIKNTLLGYYNFYRFEETHLFGLLLDGKISAPGARTPTGALLTIRREECILKLKPLMDKI